MLWENEPILRNQQGDPVPQQWNPETEQWEVAEVVQKTEVTGSIVSTKNEFRAGNVEANTVDEFIYTEKESIIHDFRMRFGIDDSSLRVNFKLFDGSEMNHITLEAGAAFITPRRARYSGLFELLLDESGEYIVALKKDMKVRGFAIEVDNRTSEAERVDINLTYSEVN